MTSFEVEPGTADDPQVVVLALTGELDLTNASELEERLERALTANGSRLVLDLRRLAFVDSAALHVLFRTARSLGKERFGLVVEPQSAIARVFEIVSISEMARVGDSIDDLSARTAPSLTRARRTRFLSPAVGVFHPAPEHIARHPAKGVDMGIGLSILLIAAGAVLAWAVNAEVSGLDIQSSA